MQLLKSSSIYGNYLWLKRSHLEIRHTYGLIIINLINYRNKYAY